MYKTSFWNGEKEEIKVNGEIYSALTVVDDCFLLVGW